MAAGLRSAGKWQRCVFFSRRTLHLAFSRSNNRLAGAKLATLSVLWDE